MLTQYRIAFSADTKSYLALPRKNDLSCFKSLPSHSKLIRGGGGDHKHKIMDGPFISKYGTVSQVFLQLVVDKHWLQSAVKLEFYLIWMFILLTTGSFHFAQRWLRIYRARRHKTEENPKNYMTVDNWQVEEDGGITADCTAQQKTSKLNIAYLLDWYEIFHAKSLSTIRKQSAGN